jgi:hypothetical protein
MVGHWSDAHYLEIEVWDYGAFPNHQFGFCHGPNGEHLYVGNILSFL